jgi:hypothetical protein
MTITAPALAAHSVTDEHCARGHSADAGGKQIGEVFGGCHQVDKSEKSNQASLPEIDLSSITCDASRDASGIDWGDMLAAENSLSQSVALSL